MGCKPFPASYRSHLPDPTRLVCVWPAPGCAGAATAAAARAAAPPLHGNMGSVAPPQPPLATLHRAPRTSCWVCCWVLNSLNMARSANMLVDVGRARNRDMGKENKKHQLIN